MIGMNIGHYRVLAKLGAGGMGEVYLAQDTKLERTVALKILPPDRVTDKERIQRFLTEAKAASALNHPNVCVIHDAGETPEGLLFIAMENISGQTLDAAINERALTIAEILDIAIQVADALEEAQNKGITHRDIKPANIMITPRGQVKVLDFGLAKRQASVQQTGNASTQMETGLGVIVGTVQYMSPEQALGRDIDHRTDIFSLGVVLYQMTTRTCPFSGASAIETIDRIIHGEPRAIDSYNKEVPPEFERIIRKCLEKDRENRYQSARDLLPDLRNLKKQVAGGIITAERIRPKPRRSIPRRAYLSIALVLVIIGCPLAYYYFVWHRGQTATGSGQASMRPEERPRPAASANQEANEYFEKGILFLRTQSNISRAQDMFERALTLDPRFAEARAYHAFIYFVMIDGGYSNDSSLLYKAEEEIRQALQYNPKSAMALSARAAILLYQGRKEMVPGEVEVALKANPGDPDAKIWLMNYLQLNGDYAAVEKLAVEILQREPLFFPARMNLAECRRQQGDFTAAIRQLEKIIEQDSQNIYAIVKLARAYGEKGDLRMMHLTLESARPDDRKNYQFRLARALQLALERQRVSAFREMDEEVLKYAAIIPYLTSMVAEFYAVLGNTPKSLEWLDRALRIGDERAEWFSRDPLLASIRNEPGFKQILEAIALRRQMRAQALKKQ